MENFCRIFLRRVTYCISSSKAVDWQLGVCACLCAWGGGKEREQIIFAIWDKISSRKLKILGIQEFIHRGCALEKWVLLAGILISCFLYLHLWIKYIIFLLYVLLLVFLLSDKVVRQTNRLLSRLSCFNIKISRLLFSIPLLHKLQYIHRI